MGLQTLHFSIWPIDFQFGHRWDWEVDESSTGREESTMYVRMVRNLSKKTKTSKKKKLKKLLEHLRFKLNTQLNVYYMRKMLWNLFLIFYRVTSHLIFSNLTITHICCFLEFYNSHLEFVKNKRPNMYWNSTKFLCKEKFYI